MAKTQKYDENSIQILEGLEAVRKRPGMYIGSTDSRGLHHLVWETVDNAIDESLNGFGKKITITLEKNGAVCEDEGRGCRSACMPAAFRFRLFLPSCMRAASFIRRGYKTSGGLHGVGASVVNALSEWLR
ncbi:MAG: ATP-binding protein [Holdemania filiformis]